jgi:nucleotide-binding universal stress UspA family protein
MQENYVRNGMILVALDGSPSSFSAARMAIHIAKCTNQMIYGLYVLESRFISDNYSVSQVELPDEQKPLSRPAMLINLEAVGNQALSTLKLECQKAGVPVITEIVIGSVPESIQQKTDQCMLVVIGRRGQDHPNGSKFLGENLRPICHMINKPILVGGDMEPLIRRILLAVPNESSFQKSIEAVSRFGDSLLEEIDQPESQSPPIKSDQNTKSSLPNRLSLVRPLVRLVSKSAVEIAAEAIDQKADLLILADYPHITPLGWLEGTLPEQVIRKVKTPVLLI